MAKQAYGRWVAGKSKMNDILAGTTKTRIDVDESFAIDCLKSGISLQGALMIITQADLEAFAKLVTDAWKEHLKMTTKLSESPTTLGDAAL